MIEEILKQYTDYVQSVLDSLPALSVPDTIKEKADILNEISAQTAKYYSLADIRAHEILQECPHREDKPKLKKELKRIKALCHYKHFIKYI